MTVLIRRLKDCDPKQIVSNPRSMLDFYPIRDPDSELTIYDEIYTKLNQSLLTKTYRFRFLFFLNTLLSSSKVPAYVIASYMKQLSRLSLSAKPRILVVILKLVANLLLRHPVLLVLRDRVDEIALEMESVSSTCTLKDWLDRDPFDADPKTAPKDTKAMDSSLWELMPLRYHENERIADVASYLGSTNIEGMENDISRYIKK